MKRLLAVSFLSVVMTLIAAHGLSAQNLTITNARIIVGNGEVIGRLECPGRLCSVKRVVHKY